MLSVLVSLSLVLASLSVTVEQAEAHIQQTEAAPSAVTTVPHEGGLTIPQGAFLGDCEPFRNLIAAYDWPVETALEVCHHESHGRVYASNPEAHRGCQGSHSLFQVACIHWKAGEDPFDPAQNVHKAYQIWKQSGFHQPWKTTCTKKMDCG